MGLASRFEVPAKVALLTLVLVVTAAMVLQAGTSRTRVADGKDTRSIIAWNPPSLAQTITPGETKTVSVNFTSSKNLRKVSIQVSPGLASVVRIQTPILERVRKGEVKTVAMVIAPDASATQGTFVGTIQVRKVEDDERDEWKEDDGDGLADQLRVTLNIWPKSMLPLSGVRINFPPSLVAVAASASTSDSVGFYDAPEKYSQGLPPLFSVSVTSLPQGLSLREWVKSFGIEQTDIIIITVGNRVYLRWFESIGDGMGTVSFSSLLDAQRIVTLSSAGPSFVSSPEFAQIISSLGTP